MRRCPGWNEGWGRSLSRSGAELWRPAGACLARQGAESGFPVAQGEVDVSMECGVGQAAPHRCIPMTAECFGNVNRLFAPEPRRRLGVPISGTALARDMRALAAGLALG